MNNTPRQKGCEDIKELIAAVSENESRAKSNSHRIDRLEREFEALNRLAISVEVLAEQQKNMLEKIISVDKKVGELEKLPKDRWNNLIGYILSALVCALITAAASGLLG